MIQETSNSLIFGAGENTRLNEWLFTTVQQYIRGRALEICSGEGQFASLVAAQGIDLYLSDPHKANRDKLREKFAGVVSIKDVFSIDPICIDFFTRYGAASETFHTIITVNVTEYGYSDKMQLNNILSLLKPKGKIIALAPIYTSLFNGLNENLDRWKRYNSESLELLLGKQMEILKTKYCTILSNPDSRNLRKLGLSAIVVARKSKPNA